MGMLLKPSDLLPGEGKVMTKGANLIVSIKEAGLSRFVADKYFWITGMEGKEAIGGLAHLTRIIVVIFKSHSIKSPTRKLFDISTEYPSPLVYRIQSPLC